MHYTLCLVSHNCTFALDPAVQEPEELQELAVEGTNPKLEQGKPRCIKQLSLNFVYFYILVMILESALSYRSWIDAQVVLRQLSGLSL
jgi:hypothetical protein